MTFTYGFSELCPCLTELPIAAFIEMYSMALQPVFMEVILLTYCKKPVNNRSQRLYMSLLPWQLKIDDLLV